MAVNLPQPLPEQEPASRPRPPLLHVAVPAGATVVTAADNCKPTAEDPAVYDCRSPGEILPGETIAFPFELRLDADLVNVPVTGTTVVPDDGVPADNVAHFIINPSAGAPSAEPSAPSTDSTDATSTGTTAGTGGGSLPITGPSSTLPIAATLVTAGIALLAAARRTQS